MVTEADVLITGGVVLTMDRDRTVYACGSVAVSGNRIVAVGPSDEVDKACEAGEVIDATGAIVMPGLVSCHGHACNSLVRGMAEDLPLHDWLTKVLWPAMSHAGSEEIYWGSLVAAVEMLQAGVTTFADMWTDVPATARAVEATGLRALLAHNLRDFGDSTRTGIELDKALAAWRDCDGMADGRIRVGLAPHSVYACTGEMLREARRLASQHSLRLQIHLAETKKEFDDCVEQHGASPVAYLDRLGFLASDVIAAHVVWMGDRDIETLRRHDVKIAHCAASNCKLGSGISPVVELKAAGLTVGIGTDGPASNNALDLLSDIKLAALLQKGANRQPKAMPAADVVAMATCEGATALGLEGVVGRLATGHLADIIAIDTTGAHMTPFHPEDPVQAYAHLVYCAKSSDLLWSMVDGQMRLKDGRVIGLDEAEVVTEATRRSRKMLQASGLLPTGPK